MNYEGLEQIYFLHFLTYKAYGITEQDTKTYAARNVLNPRYFLPFAFHLSRIESKRLYEFEKYGLTLRNKHNFLWSMVCQVIDGENQIAENTDTWSVGQASEYLFHVCLEKEFKEQVFRHKGNALQQVLCAILKGYFGMDSDIEISDESGLHEIYGGSPIISRIPRQEKWMAVLR